MALLRFSNARPGGRARRWLTCLGLVLLAVLGWFAWHEIDQWRAEQRGKALLSAAEYAQAADVLEAAAARHPADAHLAFLTAVACRRLGDGDRLEKFLRQAERLGWPQKEIQLQRLLLQTQSGLGDDASESALNQICIEGTDDFTAEQIYEARAVGYMSVYRAPAAYQALGYWIKWKPDAIMPRLLRAQLYEQEDATAQAEADYQAIVDAHPEHVEARIRLARFLLLAHKDAEALQHFQRCARDAPEDPRVIVGLADIAYSRGEHIPRIEEQLEELLTRELDEDSRSRALRLLSSIYLGRKDYRQVVKLLTQTAEKGRLDAPGYQSLIRAHTALEQPDQAERYRRLQQRSLRLRDEALELDRLIRKNPSDPDLRYRQGMKFWEAEDHQAAATWWYTALLAEPLHQASHEALADYYLAQGNSVKAARHRLGAEKSVERTFHLAWTAYTKEDLAFVELAIPKIAKYSAYKPHAELLQCAVAVHRQQSSLEPAQLERLRPLLDYPRLRNRALIVLGSGMFQLGRFGEAEEALLEALRNDPQSIQAHRWLAAMNFDIRALDRLYLHCEQWASLDPTDYRPHRLIGLESKLRQAFTPAINAYQESLRRDPNQPTRQQVLTELAECQFRLAKPNDAIETLKMADKSIARDVLLAQCYWAVQRKDDAKELLIESLKREPENRVANTLLSDIAMQEDDFQAARRHLETVTGHHPFEHTGWFKLSQVCLQLNDVEAARQASRKAERLRTEERRYFDVMEKALQLPDDIPIRRELAVRARQLGRHDLAEEWDRAADLLQARADAKLVLQPPEASQPGLAPLEAPLVIPKSAPAQKAAGSDR